MCDTTSSENFFRPWDKSPMELDIKYEKSDEERTIGEDNHLSKTFGYQPLELLSDFVNQTTTEIDKTRLSKSPTTSINNTTMKKDKDDYYHSSAFSPILNSDSAMLPSLRSYLPPFSYNSDLLNVHSQGFIAMDCLNHYAAKIQDEVNLLHQQDLVVKQLKKLRPKKYKCDYCENAFSNKGQLKGHTRIHTGERPYKCDNINCGKTFTRNEELTRHKKIHTGDKPHKCPCCNKCFGRKDHLKKHMKTHEKGSFNYPPSYQFAGAIPYIPASVLSPSQTSPVPVTFMYPFI